MPSANERPAHRAVNWDTRLQQREKFTVRIKNNVREYGGGNTCLKELLANADDAKASHFTVCLDKSRYPTDQLLSASMEDLQGPALWVCNDAKFSAKDWQNYTLSVGESAKANDITKIGKFGLGALTAYSLTDVIQIISGDSLLILDPHGSHLPDQLPSVFGNMVNNTDEHFVDVAADSPDQLEPFLSFTKHCPSVPTFSTGKHYPGSLFRLAFRTPAAAWRSEISNESLSPDQFAQTLQDFVQAAPDLLLFTRHVKSISVFMKGSKDSQCTLMHDCTATISSITSTVAGCKVQEAIITCQYGSGPQRHSVWHKASHNTVNSQSGDVAVLVHEGGMNLPKVLGKVYSTVALPLAPTSLPVHINGDFRLSSDRRTLWAGEGDRGQGDKNKCVLIDDIAPAYAAAITSACATEPAPEIFQYWKWPTAHSLQPQLLDSVTSATVNQLVTNDCKVLWAPAADMSSVRSDGSVSGKWVAPSEACLVQPSDAKASSVIINVARRSGLHIPVVPSHIFKALTPFSSSVTFFSAQKLRRSLLNAGNVVKPDEVSEVLSYVISDGEYWGLDGLHLILLNNGSIEQFKWDSRDGEQYFVCTDSKSESILNLMEVSQHKLIQTSSIWSTLSRAKLGDIHLLESKYLNVQVPTMGDLAPNLPKSWQQSVCNIGPPASHPTPEWLETFWDLMASMPGAVPESLHAFALVPITGHQLASIQHCIQHKAFSQAHLQYLPSYAASTLSSIGCVCIEDPRADKANRTVTEAWQRLFTALGAASRCLGMPLTQLLSQERLGSTDFENARHLLADCVRCSTETWDIIRHCPIFEDTTGQMVTLGAGHLYGLLPAASWEEHMPALILLLPWTPVKYHTASVTQQNLIKHSSMPVPSVTDFLQSELLPAIRHNNSCLTEQLLLHAIDELARVCSDSPGSLSNLNFISINGSLHQISKMVDSSSSLLQTLFSKPCSDDDYKLLPQCYASPTRLAVLKRHGLRQLGTADPDFFISCAERFTGMSNNFTRDEKRRLSRGLADMLQSNVTVDTYWNAQTRNVTRARIASCPIFKTAQLQFPYNSTQPEFVALASSADHDHYQLVSLALPVIDNSHGDTKALRRQLGLHDQPGLKYVVDHLLKLTAMPDLKAALQPGSPMHKFMLEGIQKGYQFIISIVSGILTRAGSHQGMTILADESNKLAQGAWVLVQDCKFVRPCELCFDLEEDTSQGYEVPRMLMTLINAHPAVKRWFIDALKVTDLHDGAPSVKQLHENPVTATTSVAKYLEGDFNNPAAYPDAILCIDGQQIHVHKRVVARACTVLARHWDPLWSSSNDPIAMDTSLCCHNCNIHPSYSTALLFLEYFYTGEVMWPDKQADVQTAVELLVMACMYDVQHLVCIAEMALQCLLDTDNCCAIFAIANHHEAVQLRARCLHFIKQGHRLIKSSEQYRGLDRTLQAEVELAVSHNA